MRTKILFDTDPGIDDALALLMLARDPRAELVGIGTVFGNAAVEQTTTNTLALCERFGIDVPVARGAARPLVRAPRGFPVEVHGRDGLGDVEPRHTHSRAPDTRDAASFIRDMAEQHDGELVLVAVGPLTNLAHALALDPGLPRRVRQVVVMGGAFGTLGHHGNATPFAEANVFCDPHAADAVFAAGWPVTIVGLDVTHQVLMDPAVLASIGDHGGAAGRFIRSITRPYEAFHRRRGVAGIYAHDASAVACALDASRFGLRRSAVRVLGDGEAMGQTLLVAPGGSSDDGRPEQQVCMAVDAAGVLADFRACFVSNPSYG